MCLKNWCALVVVFAVTGLCSAQNPVIPTTTLADQKANNTSTADTFTSQSNGNMGGNNVSKVDIHSLLYAGANTKVYAHLLLWFGSSGHMNVGYSSTDPAQIHRQIVDMISRGIDGIIIDWYGPNNRIDQTTKLVMAEAENHPGFTFAIMVDQGAIEWDSCSGCSPQQALISQLQYIEQTYFPSKAYMTVQGRPVITNFNIDLSYSIDWSQVTQALSTQPVYWFQNNAGFTHTLSDGSYSWVMPTTSDYGMSYLKSFYDTGMPFQNEQAVGASYKGFNDTLASWGSHRIMGQQCGQTWLQTFAKINSLYDSANQLYAAQLVTWNDYEEATEIESGIDNCVGITASVSGPSLQWTATGDPSTIDHFTPYISADGQNLMSLGNVPPDTDTLNLCNSSVANGTYTLYVQAVGKPAMTNRISGGVQTNLKCDTAGSGSGSGTGSSGTGSSGGSGSASGLTLATSVASLTLASGNSGSLSVSVTPKSGSFDYAVYLSCSGLPATVKCSFAPNSVIPGNGAGHSVLTFAGASSSAADYKQGRNFLLAESFWGLGIGGFFLAGKPRRSIMRALAVCAIAIVILGTVSCGGSAPITVGGVTPKSYVVTVSGKSGSLKLSTTVAVTVQ